MSIAQCRTQNAWLFVISYVRSAIINWTCPEMSGKWTGFNRSIYLTQIILFLKIISGKQEQTRRSEQDKTNFARKNPLPASVLNSRNLHLLKEKIFSQTKNIFSPKRVFLRKSPHPRLIRWNWRIRVTPTWFAHVSVSNNTWRNSEKYSVFKLV